MRLSKEACIYGAARHQLLVNPTLCEKAKMKSEFKKPNHFGPIFVGSVLLFGSVGIFYFHNSTATFKCEQNGQCHLLKERLLESTDEKYARADIISINASKQGKMGYYLQVQTNKSFFQVHFRKHSLAELHEAAAIFQRGGLINVSEDNRESYWGFLLLPAFFGFLLIKTSIRKLLEERRIQYSQ